MLKNQLLRIMGKKTQRKKTKQSPAAEPRRQRTESVESFDVVLDEWHGLEIAAAATKYSNDPHRIRYDIQEQIEEEEKERKALEEVICDFEAGCDSKMAELTRTFEKKKNRLDQLDRAASEMALNAELLQLQINKMAYSSSKRSELQKMHQEESRRLMTQMLEAAFSLNASTHTEGEGVKVEVQELLARHHGEVAALKTRCTIFEDRLQELELRMAGPSSLTAAAASAVRLRPLKLGGSLGYRGRRSRNPSPAAAAPSSFQSNSCQRQPSPAASVASAVSGAGSCARASATRAGHAAVRSRSQSVDAALQRGDVAVAIAICQEAAAAVVRATSLEALGSLDADARRRDPGKEHELSSPQRAWATRAPWPAPHPQQYQQSSFTPALAQPAGLIPLMPPQSAGQPVSQHSSAHPSEHRAWDRQPFDPGLPRPVLPTPPQQPEEWTQDVLTDRSD